MMDIEKLIEQLNNLEACAYSYHINGEVLGMDCSDFEQLMVDAVEEISKISTLQVENEKLREAVDKYATAARAIALHLKPFCDESLPYDEMIADAARKASDELEQVKRERDAAVEQLHGICSACRNYSPYHNKGKCRFCVYEPARDKDAGANDNWQWRGIKED